MYKHILIPTDGSELAERAVTHGLSLAKFVGAKVTVIIVEEPPPNWLTFPGSGSGEAFAKFVEEIKEYYASALDRATKAAKQAGVPCETIQVHDVPYKAIIAAAADRGCDLIAMSSHGRGGLTAMMLGSVTHKVLTHTKTPVLVCQ
jgi:nucleotide-binding universal stress UspA family protein